MTTTNFITRLVGGVSLGAVLAVGAIALGGSVTVGTQPAAAAIENTPLAARCGSSWCWLHEQTHSARASRAP